MARKYTTLSEAIDDLRTVSTGNESRTIITGALNFVNENGGNANSLGYFNKLTGEWSVLIPYYEFVTYDQLTQEFYGYKNNIGG